MKKYLIFLLLLFPITMSAQKSSKVLIEFSNGKPMAALDNYVTIVAQQDKPVSIDQVKVYLHIWDRDSSTLRPQKIEGRNGGFVIRPDSLGTLEFHIELESGVEIIRKHVTLITAICRLGGWNTWDRGRLSTVEFKSQKGIVAQIECCGFDARCKVMGFLIIRISKRKRAKMIYNKGSRFDAASLKLINKAKAGDIYIFRNISYRCPGAYDEIPQHGADIAVGIRKPYPSEMEN